MLKVAILLFGLVWLRATLPRMRYDQLMELGWKWLLPLALINLIVTPIIVVLVPNVLIQTGILFVFGVAVLFAVDRLGRSRLTGPKSRVRLVQLSPAGRGGNPPVTPGK
jgi:NADH-quinone oxidoreductase subunit H